MADALISVVLEQLASYVQSQVTLVVETSEEVVKLTGNLKLIQSVLADADQKQVKNEAVRVWLHDLKQVVYDADDVLDEWLTRAAISNIQSSGDVTAGTGKKVLSCLLSPCYCFKDAIVSYDISRQIKVINMRLDVIARQRTDFGLSVLYQNHNESRRLTSSVVDVSKIHGRDQAKADIISRLLGESSLQGSALCVIAIVGIGGLGKTTLAKLIFNEERVVDFFKMKMWVCVSEPFNLVGVAHEIIKAANGDGTDSEEWEEVHKCLCKSVKGKQFLLVLDDVWTEDPSHWNQLKLALDGGSSGSRIIVTTRNRNVAQKMGCADPNIYDLEKLSDDDSWSIIKDVAFVAKEKKLEIFEKVGKRIAIKCKGVPLAIVTVASLLCERRTKEEWKDVLVSDLWEMPEIKSFFLPSLFLSYYSLDAISKQCFLYCTVFPKDFQMDKDYLIRLWMAQGFFGYEERRELERTGKNHFHILAMRSFFQDFEYNSDGNIMSCKMHDLVHDFAIYISQNECSYLKEGDAKFDGDKIRHLFASDLDIPFILEGRKLRTLSLSLKNNAVPVDLFHKLACLRTLILSSSLWKVLPDELGKLVHLRYLEFSCSNLLEVPDTVCNLYNLQVLKFSWCSNLSKLPEKIGKLSNLRQLLIEGPDCLGYLPKTIATLSSLRELSMFIVSGVSVDHKCTIGDLQLLNNLQGGLELYGLSQVTDESDVIRAELKKKTKLQKLSFHFEEERSHFSLWPVKKKERKSHCVAEERGVSIRMKNVLEKLEPHEDLEILEVYDYPDSQFPGWVQSCLLLTNIVQISLNRCLGCVELPAFGKLVSLETLVISFLPSVTRIGHEFYGFDAQMTAFPRLKLLQLLDLKNLEEWELPISKDTKIMPLLVEIHLMYCQMLRALPCLGRLESLESLGMVQLSSVERFGNELYGFDAESSSSAQVIAFPELKALMIEDMDKLEEWELPISKDTKIMPLLVEIQLKNCPILRALPCLGTLTSLEKLDVTQLSSVECIGNELYGVGVGSGSSAQVIAFPKLKFLRIQEMKKLEEWEVPISKGTKSMPILVEMELKNFPVLRALPCLGSLESLCSLKMWDLPSVKYIGDDFYGFGADISLGVEMVAFPKLKTLAVSNFIELEEWKIPISKARKVMPFLHKLELTLCGRLKVLPRVWKMESLEKLELVKLPSVERVGLQFLGVAADYKGSLQDGVTLPKLESLIIKDMSRLEEWSIPLIVPRLVQIELWGLSKLKTLPIFSCMKTLESLKLQYMLAWEGQEKIVTSDKEGSSGGAGATDSCLCRLTVQECPKLDLVPAYMFSPSLETLELIGNLGALYYSFPADTTLCSITKVSLSFQSHSCLPKGFDQLKALEMVEFHHCKTLDFDLKELGRLTMLRDLTISRCPILNERFKGDDWKTTLAHVPRITIDMKEITKKS